MLFWGLVAIVLIGAGGLLGMALWRGQDGVASSAEYDVQVYRDQLAEVDRDLARGVLTAEDAERTRVEISRRILAADAELKNSTHESGNAHMAGWGFGLVAVVALLAGAVFSYWHIGAPGYQDMPLAARYAAAEAAHENRLSQAEIEAKLPENPTDAEANTATPENFLTLMKQLRATVAKRPDDLQGQALLARNEASLGNFQAAHLAQAQVIRLKDTQATAEDFTTYADLLISAARGYVSKDADMALRQALVLNPLNKTALYYMGLNFLQTGRPDLTFQAWRGLLERSQPEDPWVPLIREQLENVAALAGEKYQLPPAETMPGPNAADVQAAGQMSAPERQEMIRNMVTRLSERLATKGGTPEEWARLIGAYGVLGETEKARAIWAEAQTVFADKPDALSTIRTGAEKAGVLE